MKQTFVPKYSFAKATGTDMRISTKSAEIICSVIRNKPLTRSKRLLTDLAAGTRSLEGKYYTKTVEAILNLINSCEKNAEFKNLDMDRLFVHASAHQGPNTQRRRRKGAFGNRMKSTHMEVMLIERGKQAKERVKKQDKPVDKEDPEIRARLKELKKEQEQLKKDVEEAEKISKQKPEAKAAEARTEEGTQ